jgi:hypothetical protein
MDMPAHPIPRMTRRALAPRGALRAWLAAAIPALAMAACGTVGDVGTLELTSLGGTSRTLRAALGTGTYAQEPAQTSFILSDVDFAQIEAGEPAYGYVLHVNLLWVPKAGRTAVDPTATNTSIRLVVLAGKELGVYGGGGFAWPAGTLGEETFALELVGSNLSLIACTPGFQDLMSPASLTGTLNATLDDAATRRMRRSASQYVTNATRSVRWVKALERLNDHIWMGGREPTHHGIASRICSAHGDSPRGSAPGAHMSSSEYSHPGAASGGWRMGRSCTISHAWATGSKSSATARAGAAASAPHSSSSSRTMPVSGASPISTPPPGANSHMSG